MPVVVLSKTKSCALVALAAASAASSAHALTLEEALLRAERQHPQLQAARAQVQVVEARAEVARQPLLPTASLDVNHSQQTANFVPRPGFVPRTINVAALSQSAEPFPFWQATAQGRWTAWDFGRTDAQVLVQTRTAAAATADVAALRQALRFQVASAYLQALASEQVLAQAQDARQLAATRREVARRKVEASVRPALDLQKSDADLAAAEVAVLRAEEGVRSARVALAATMGDAGALADADPLLWPEAAAAAGEALERSVASPAERKQAVADAAARRPEFAALQARVAALEADVAAQDRTIRPTLYVSAQTSVAGTALSGLVWNAGVTGGVNWGLTPLWTQSAQLQATRAQIRALQAQRDQQLLALQTDVEQARLALAQAQKRLPAVEALLKWAAEARTSATKRYEAGVATALEVSDAESQWNQARLQKTDAEVSVLVARARLAFALGLL